MPCLPRIPCRLSPYSSRFIHGEMADWLPPSLCSRERYIPGNQIKEAALTGGIVMVLALVRTVVFLIRLAVSWRQDILARLPRLDADLHIAQCIHNRLGM